MTIFMIERDEWAGEDYNGRDYYNEVLDRDLGYFTSYEAAQAVIVAEHARERESHDKQIARLEAENIEINKKRELAEAQKKVMQEVYEANGWGRPPYSALPSPHRIPSFSPSDLRIIEIEPGD